MRSLPPWLLWPYRGVCLVVLAWLLVCLLLLVFQRRLIYLPAQVAELPPPETLPWATVEPLQYAAFDGLTLHGWRVRPRGAATTASTTGAMARILVRPRKQTCIEMPGPRGIT
jgi:hypothetical protein